VPHYQLTQLEWQAFHALGDVNGDGYIDRKDIALAQKAFGSSPGTVNWNPAADLNGDGKVDMKDIAIVGRNQGLNIWDYYGVKKPIPKWVWYAIGAGVTTVVTVGVAYYALKRRS